MLHPVARTEANSMGAGQAAMGAILVGLRISNRLAEGLRVISRYFLISIDTRG